MTNRHCLFLLLCALLFSACSDNEDDNTVLLKFSVTINAIEAYTATATITHNGSNRDTYYAFCVEGGTTDARQEVSKLLASNRKETVLAAGMKQRKHVTTLTGLSAHTAYSCIVFGLDANGQLRGEPATTQFTTADPPFTATENPNWTVTYKGHTVYNDWDYSLVNVRLNGDAEERFILAVCQSTEPDDFNTIEDFIAHEVYDFTKEKNENESNDFWFDDSSVRTGSTNFYRYLEPGDYVAYALGVNADGTPTGSYAKCEPFHVDKYPYTEDYANLTTGDWVFVDQNDRWYFLTFRERIVNRSFYMAGWGNHDEFEAVVNYDRTTGKLSIPYQRITNEQTTVHFSDGDETGYIYLVGAYYNDENKLRWTAQNHTICNGYKESDGSYTFTSGFYVNLDDGTRAEEMGMTFVVHRTITDRVGFARMTFPITLKKLEE